MHRLLLLAALAACATSEPPAEAPADAAERQAAEAPAAEGTAQRAAVNATAELEKTGHWGAEFSLTNSEPIQTLIDDPDPHVGREIRVVGEVTNVCQKAGCWMVLRGEGGDSVRITMKDHGFAVAKDLAGKDCHVQGTVVKKKVDPETVAHYESEGGTDEVPERGKSEVIEIVAVSVGLAES